jgi:hypothetical protein
MNDRDLRLAAGLFLLGDREKAWELITGESKNHVHKPSCYTCPHRTKNENYFEKKAVFGKIDGKRRKRWIMPGDSWCLNGAMFRINLSHLRWWGFDRRCPLNPYNHHCELCGLRMCTADKMCKTCAKNRLCY